MHAVFCIGPYTGHVNTSLAVVSELTRRGHRVSYATTAAFSAPAREAGARAVVYGSTMEAHSGRSAGQDPASSAAGPDFARGQDGQLRELKAVLPVLLAAFADDAPDVVVCDPMCWAGRALAARFRVPAINNVTVMIAAAHWSLGPAGASFNPADPRMPQLFAATSAVLAHYRTGLTADQLLGTGGMIPTIVYLPRAFQAQGDQFGPDIHFIGPCLSPRRDRPRSGPGSGRDWQPPGSGPVVLVSLGTVFNRDPAVFRRCLDALAGLDCHVVVALGGLAAAELGPLPANAEAHGYLQLTEVLPHADVLVGHAGMASTMEALSFGVPIAAVPQIPEQRANADRLAELGLGLCLAPPRQTRDEVRRAVVTLLQDTSIRPRLDWMRAEIGRAPGAPAAAEVIENALRPPGRGRHENLPFRGVIP